MKPVIFDFDVLRNNLKVNHKSQIDITRVGSYPITMLHIQGETSWYTTKADLFIHVLSGVIAIDYEAMSSDNAAEKSHVLVEAHQGLVMSAHYTYRFRAAHASDILVIGSSNIK